MASSAVPYVHLSDSDEGFVPERYFDPDLDSLFMRCYTYYRDKGLVCMLLSGIFYLLTMLLIVLFVGFAMEFVDYSRLFSVGSVSQAFDWHFPINPLFWIFMLISGAFVVIQFGLFLRDIPHYFEIRRFYSAHLHISDAELQTLEWSTVAYRITRVPGLCITKEEGLNQLDIVNRIMRRENYIIALLNQDAIPHCVEVPLLGSFSIFTRGFNHVFLSVITNVLFQTNDLRPEVLSAKTDIACRRRFADALRTRFRFFGFIFFLFSPITFPLWFAYAILRFGEEIKSRPAWLGTRQWSRYALWKLRNFNELTHYFRNRLARANRSASEYVNQFRSNVLVIVARFLLFLIGAIVFLIVLLSFLDDDFLVNVQLFGRNGLWYLGVFGAMLAVLRSLIPPNEIFTPEETMQEVYKHTSYMPSDWEGRCHTYQVLGEFEELYEYRVFGFLRELFSPFVTPLVFFFCIPQCCEEIVMHIASNTVEVHGVGHISSFANFEFAKHGNPQYGATVEGGALNHAKDGKMERSFLHFTRTYPEWQPPPEGCAMMASLVDFMTHHTDTIHDESTVALAQSISLTTPNPVEAISRMEDTQINVLQQSFFQHQRNVHHRDPPV